jgi:CRP-like cAMP-binding protein
VNFLELFETRDRDRLLALAESVVLGPGEHLLRRGEQGGDLFVVEKGTLEIVDPRTHPVTVIQILETGTLVGELAFLDPAPRSASVLARTAANCHALRRASLQAALESDGAFAARFYANLAQVLASRVRVSTEIAGSGLRTRSVHNVHITAAISQGAHAIVQDTLSQWAEAEQDARADPNDANIAQRMSESTDHLLREASEWLHTLRDSEQDVEAGQALAQELRPYLIRSQTAECCWESDEEPVPNSALLAHVLLNEAKGEGLLGQVLDARLLNLPTCQALRHRTLRAAEPLTTAAAQEGATKVTLIGVGCGALLGSLTPAFSRHGARIRCLDDDPKRLAWMDFGMGSRPTSVSIVVDRQDILAVCQGTQPSAETGTEDFVLVDGLLDHLPQRLLGGLFTWCGELLAPEGTLVLTALEPSSDAPLFDHVLGWPTIRRTADRLVSLLAEADLDGEILTPTSNRSDPALVLIAKRKT